MTPEQKTRRIALGLAAIVAAIWAGLYGLGHSRGDVIIAYAYTSFIFERPETVGTSAMITAFHPPTTTTPILNEKVDGIFADVHQRVSIDIKDSEVSRFNAMSSTAPFALSPETIEILACALEVGGQTAGAFDLTTGAIARAHDPLLNRTPTEDELRELRTHIGLDKLEFDPQARTLRKTDPALFIDLDTLRCGYALDRVVRVFEDAGAKQYRIEVGPVFYGKEGDRDEMREPDGRVRPMKIAMAVLSEKDFNTAFGMPIVDGRTGMPAAQNLASVTVLHEKGLWAEAYARAIWVLGADDGLLLAKLLKLPVLVRDKDGAESASEAYEARFGAVTAH